MSKKTLVNENVIRRWGTLANISPITENWLAEQDEEAEDVEAAAEDEVAAGEAEMEAGEEAEASEGEMEAVQGIVQAVVDAISQETGVDIEVEDDDAAGDEAAMDDMDAGMDASDELDDAADDEMDDADAAMRDPYSRKDITETGAKRDGESKGDKGKDKEDPEDRDYSGKGMRKGDKSKTHAGVDETLEIDVVDDEALTEAVLKRVVERLLKRK
jgi:hypothetical protein